MMLRSTILLLLLAASAVRAEPVGTQLDAAFSRQQALIDELQKQVAALRDSRPLLTWDDCGCKPDDPTFDNGPILTRMLADQCDGTIRTVTKGRLGNYYIRTPVVWPQWTGGALEGAGGYTYAISTQNIGCTRLVWAGERGGTMVEYHGSGGRIGRLILCGGPLTNDYKSVAGCGVCVSAHANPPSGNLVTDQLSIVQCDVGLHYLETPDNNHADLQKHFALLTHFVRVPYWVEGKQSCPHWFFGFDCREGYETALKFSNPRGEPAGGSLAVFGMYLGGSDGATLLDVDRSNDYVGRYAIDGLQVDGAVHDLTLVRHGLFCFDVVIRGRVGKRDQLAREPVVARQGKSKWQNITIDVGSTFQLKSEASK